MSEIRSRTKRNGLEYEKLQRESEIHSLKEENQMLRDQLDRYQTQIRLANEQLIQIKQRYQMLVNELALREKAADEISRLALKEANAIIETAQGNADLIVKEALDSARMVFVEVEHLTHQTNGMRKEIQQKLYSMDVMLNNFQIPEIPNLDFLIEEKPKLGEKEKGDEQDAPSDFTF